MPKAVIVIPNFQSRKLGVAFVIVAIIPAIVPETKLSFNIFYSHASGEKTNLTKQSDEDTENGSKNIIEVINEIEGKQSFL